MQRSQGSNLFFLQNKSEFYSCLKESSHICFIHNKNIIWNYEVCVCFKSNVAINKSFYNNIIIINKLYCVQDNILLSTLLIYYWVISPIKDNNNDNNNNNSS